MPSADSNPEMHLPITVTNRSVLDWGHAYHLPITVTNRSVLGWGHTYPIDSHPEIHFSMTVIERLSPRVGVGHRNPLTHDSDRKVQSWDWGLGGTLLTLTQKPTYL